MEIGSKYAGARLKECRREINWREMMNYAAAVGDANPAYFDDRRKGGIVAQPIFAVAVTWPILERVWEYIEAPDFPKEVLMTQVHYSERLEFHRPIAPGDRLSVSGEVAAVLPHRAGTHIVMKLCATDAAGAPVFTEYTGAMLRGVKCADGGAGEGNIPKVPELTADGGPVWKSEIEIDPLAPFIYDGCSNIFFPIHTSARFAAGVGLPGIILQGAATLALAVRELVNREADGNPAALKSVACRFGGMVLPGTKICVELRERSERGGEKELFFGVRNAEGKNAIGGGYAVVE